MKIEIYWQPDLDDLSFKFETHDQAADFLDKLLKATVCYTSKFPKKKPTETAPRKIGDKLVSPNACSDWLYIENMKEFYLQHKKEFTLVITQHALVNSGLDFTGILLSLLKFGPELQPSEMNFRSPNVQGTLQQPKVRRTHTIITIIEQITNQPLIEIKFGSFEGLKKFARPDQLPKLEAAISKLKASTNNGKALTFFGQSVQKGEGQVALTPLVPEIIEPNPNKNSQQTTLTNDEIKLELLGETIPKLMSMIHSCSDPNKLVTLQEFLRSFIVSVEAEPMLSGDQTRPADSSMDIKRGKW